MAWRAGTAGDYLKKYFKKNQGIDFLTIMPI